MRKKSKRVWTDEQRQAAADRMRKMVMARRAKKAEGDVPVNIPEELPAIPEESKGEPIPVKEHTPEVQAIIDTMDPARRAKLLAMQSKILSTGFTSDRERMETMLRHDAERVRGMQTETQTAVLEAPPVAMTANTVLPPSRIGSYELNLIIRTDGTMVSVNGPCLCGKGKREWHSICLKESV